MEIECVNAFLYCGAHFFVYYNIFIKIQISVAIIAK